MICITSSPSKFLLGPFGNTGLFFLGIQITQSHRILFLLYSSFLAFPKKKKLCDPVDLVDSTYPLGPSLRTMTTTQASGLTSLSLKPHCHLKDVSTTTPWYQSPHYFSTDLVHPWHLPTVETYTVTSANEMNNDSHIYLRDSAEFWIRSECFFRPPTVFPVSYQSRRICFPDLL